MELLDLMVQHIQHQQLSVDCVEVKLVDAGLNEEGMPHYFGDARSGHGRCRCRCAAA